MKKRYLAVSALLGWLLLVIVLMIISGYVNTEVYFVLGLIGLMTIAILITPIYSRPRYTRRLLVIRMLGAALFVALFFEQFLVGLPAISIPCGFGDTGLPCGLQLMAPALREDLLLGASIAFQDVTNFHQVRP